MWTYTGKGGDVIQPGRELAQVNKAYVTSCCSRHGIRGNMTGAIGPEVMQAWANLMIKCNGGFTKIRIAGLS